MVEEKMSQFNLSANSLKVIAVIAMFLDHASALVVSSGTVMDMVIHFFGRLAAPIMCYLIAEGYSHTSDTRRYLKRLLLFSLISHFPYVWYFDIPWWRATSVIWSLAMGLVALTAAKSPDLAVWKKIGIVLLCCLLAWNANWNYIAVLWILFFGLFRERFNLQLLSFSLIGLILYVAQGLLDFGWSEVYRFGFLLAIPLFMFYHGKKGKHSLFIKWGFYIFYPLHLLFLQMLRIVFFT